MKIEDTSFGEIIVDGEKYDHDIVITPNQIERRKKWITKNKHGTSHKFTREEMEEYLENLEVEDIEIAVIGTGQYGKLGLLKETEELLEEKEIEAIERKTPEAIEFFNDNEKPRERKLGIFHVTC